MWYRIHATRALTGGHRLIPKVNNAFKDVGDKMSFVFDQINANVKHLYPFTVTILGTKTESNLHEAMKMSWQYTFDDKKYK